ncbi:MAG: GNAT family N-acetyltransferase [Candidatus Dormibacteraeota bacterium]|nr:GNAT family N-acetyltransferase [Candidatus Dormibacteraeota bacterium]
MLDPQTLAVHRLRPDGWDDFRRIRLRALAEAPGAFSSTFEEAAQLDEAEWRRRLGFRAQFVAVSHGEAVGTAGGIDADGRAELISMWVDPSARRSGVGSRLLGAVAEWARGEGHVALWLWVVEGNLDAERLYARQGFKRTGKRQAVDPLRPARAEFEMKLSL